jgi:hypothetical protein
MTKLFFEFPLVLAPNARHHLPAQALQEDENRRVAGRVHAVVRRHIQRNTSMSLPRSFGENSNAVAISLEVGNDARNDALPLLVAEHAGLKCRVATTISVKLNGWALYSKVESEDAIGIRVFESFTSGYNLNWKDIAHEIILLVVSSDA